MSRSFTSGSQSFHDPVLSSLMQGVASLHTSQEASDPARIIMKPDPAFVMAQENVCVAPNRAPGHTLAVHHKRQSMDKSARSSSAQHSEAHIGVPTAAMAQDERYHRLATNSCPFSAQSVVTTTKTTITTVTTNISTHPGDVEQGFQPWFTTNTRTDVAESTSVDNNSELIAAGNPNSMQIEEAFNSVDDMANIHRRNGRRRSFDVTSALLPAAHPRAPTRRSRRTSNPAAVDPLHRPKLNMTATVAAIPQTPRQTPLALLQLSHEPKSSDLIILRLVIPGNAEFEASGEFLTAVNPKHSTTPTGEILVPSFSMPPHLSHINIEGCFLSFSWLSGERVQATLVSDPLSASPATGQPPLLKRPKLE